MRFFLSLPVLLATGIPATAQEPALPKEIAGLNAPADAPQPADPDALLALRAKYVESISSAERAAHGQWAAQLASLESTRAAAGDYTGADRARARKEAALAISGTDDGRLSVRLGTAEVTGKGSGLTTNASTATLSSSGAFLEWERAGDFKGWYEVRLTHAVQGSGDYSSETTPIVGPLPADRRSKKASADNPLPSAGGWVSFQNISSLTRSDNVLRRELLSTGGWNAWTTVSLGKLEINGRLARFRLTADEAYSSGLMHFRHLELVPSPPPNASSAEGESRLTRARETFDKTFRQQTTAATNRFRDGLNALEQQALRAKDTDLVVRVKNEKALLAQSPEKLALSSEEDFIGSGGPIKLTVDNSFSCQYRGETRFDNKSNRLIALRPAGSASVTWRLAAFNVGSGVYAVKVKGKVPVTGGGTATLAAFAAANAPAGNTLKFEVKPVVKPEERNKKPPEDSDYYPPQPQHVELEAGSVTIRKGAETLTLSVAGLVHNDGSLLDISSLTLTRTGDVPPPAKSP